MPEAGAGTQGHDLLWTMIAPFYAQAVDGSTVGHRSALRGARAHPQWVCRAGRAQGWASGSWCLTSRTCACWRDPLAGCSCRGRLDRDRTHVCSFVAPSQTNASPGDRYLPLFPQPARAPARLGLRCRSQVGQLPDCATGLSGWTPDRLGGTTTFRQPTPAGPVGVGVPGGGARGHHPRRIRRRGSIRRRCG